MGRDSLNTIELKLLVDVLKDKQTTSLQKSLNISITNDNFQNECLGILITKFSVTS